MLTRTARTGLNSIANLARFGVSIVVVFLLTPYIIRQVGNEDFGLWNLTLSTLGFLSLLDLGFGTSIVKYVAECRGSGDRERRNRMLSTLWVVYLLLGVLSLVVVWIFSFAYADFFRIAAGQREKATLLLWIMAVRTAVLGLPLGLFRGILFGEQRIWQINLVQACATLGYGLTAWAVLRGGYGIVALAWINLAAMILEHVAYVLLAYSGSDDLEIRTSLADATHLNEAARFSAATFIVSVSSLILLRTDPIIISFFLPLSAVAVYAVALKIVENAHLLTKQFINVLSPLIAEFKGQGDEEKIRFVLLNCARFALVPSLVVAIPLGLYASDILSLWIGAEFAAGALSLVLLLTAMTAAVPQMVASNVLTMTGHQRVTARAAVWSAIINVILSVALVRPFGIAGVAAGTLGATLAVDVGWIPKYAAGTCGIGWISYWRRIIGPLALPVTLDIGVTLLLRHLYPPASLFVVCIESVPGILLFGVSFWVAGVEESEKQLFRERLVRFKKPSPPVTEAK